MSSSDESSSSSGSDSSSSSDEQDLVVEQGGKDRSKAPAAAINRESLTDLFGEEDDDDLPPNGGAVEQDSQALKDLFGDDAELSSSEGEQDNKPDRGGAMATTAAEDGYAAKQREPVEQDEQDKQDDDDDDSLLGDREATPPPVAPEISKINVQIPRCSTNLSKSELYFVKLPNFLSIETRPFDPSLYEDEADEDQVQDEEGHSRMKLKVENTIRWRYYQDEEAAGGAGGEVTQESNTQLVRWSDGSMSLYLGGEIFDVYQQPQTGELSHLFVRQGTGLQGQAVFKTKLTLRPHSTDTLTHRKMTLSIADRFSKAQKIRVLPVVGKDPESQRVEMIKKEEERLRAAVRRESLQRRVWERHSRGTGALTSSYLEPDEEDEQSVSSIKQSVKSYYARRHGDQSSDPSDAEEDQIDEEDHTKRLPKKRRSHEQKSSNQKRSRKSMLEDDDIDSS